VSASGTGLGREGGSGGEPPARPARRRGGTPPNGEKRGAARQLARATPTRPGAASRARPRRNGVQTSSPQQLPRRGRPGRAKRDPACSPDRREVRVRRIGSRARARGHSSSSPSPLTPPPPSSSLARVREHAATLHRRRRRSRHRHRHRHWLACASTRPLFIVAVAAHATATVIVTGSRARARGHSSRAIVFGAAPLQLHVRRHESGWLLVDHRGERRGRGRGEWGESGRWGFPPRDPAGDGERLVPGVWHWWGRERVMGSSIERRAGCTRGPCWRRPGTAGGRCRPGRCLGGRRSRPRCRLG